MEISYSRLNSFLIPCRSSMDFSSDDFFVIFFNCSVKNDERLKVFHTFCFFHRDSIVQARTRANEVANMHENGKKSNVATQ